VTDTMALADIRVIDTDTHFAEPSDLWTSRVVHQWLDSVPHAEHDPASWRSEVKTASNPLTCCLPSTSSRPSPRRLPPSPARFSLTTPRPCTTSSADQFGIRSGAPASSLRKTSRRKEPHRGFI
jgi:hypothetical protein